jgi:hypothetical protein
MDVAQTGKPRRASLSRRDRLLLTALAAGLAGLLAVAAALKPDPGGHGTHRQLGLPPCTFLVLFGRPCPSCGMTTSWSCLVRGGLIEAFRASAGGALLAIAAMGGVPWLLGCGLCGRWLGGRPRSNVLAGVAVGLALVTAAQWGWRLLAG